MNTGGSYTVCPRTVAWSDWARVPSGEESEQTESFHHLGVYGSGEPVVSPCASGSEVSWPVLTCAALGALCHPLRQAAVVEWLHRELQPLLNGSVTRYAVEDLNHFLLEKWSLLEETFGVELSWNDCDDSFICEGNSLVTLVDRYVVQTYGNLVRLSSVGDGCICDTRYDKRHGGGFCSSRMFKVQQELLSTMVGDVDGYPVVLNLEQLSTKERVVLSVTVSLMGFLVLSKALGDEQCVRATWLVLRRILNEPSPPYTA